MNIITKSVDEIQNIYQRVIGEIEDKKEKEIIPTPDINKDNPKK